MLCRAGAARGSGALRAQGSLCLVLPQFSAVRFGAHIPAGMSLGCAFPGTPFSPRAQRWGDLRKGHLISCPHGVAMGKSDPPSLESAGAAIRSYQNYHLYAKKAQGRASTEQLQEEILYHLQLDTSPWGEGNSSQTQQKEIEKEIKLYKETQLLPRCSPYPGFVGLGWQHWVVPQCNPSPCKKVVGSGLDAKGSSAALQCVAASSCWQRLQ